MTKKIINRAQNYLTVVHTDNGRVYQIVNIELLLQCHPPEAVISFLEKLKDEGKKRLKKFLKNNVSDSRINDVVAKNFRIKMAINTIKNYDKGRIAA